MKGGKGSAGAWVMMLVEARKEGKASREVEWLVGFRERQEGGSWKHDYLMAWADLLTTIGGLVRVFNTEGRIEKRLNLAKGGPGLGDVRLRMWEGWGHQEDVAKSDSCRLMWEIRKGTVHHVAMTGLKVQMKLDEVLRSRNSSRICRTTRWRW